MQVGEARVVRALRRLRVLLDAGELGRHLVRVRVRARVRVRVRVRLGLGP